MIKIPEKYYVGIRATSGSDIPLGFATPFGTDAAFQKRKATVDNWTGKKDKGARFETYDNVLLEGYRISQEVRRYGWNGGNVVWRIEDPRGFELEISSANFASIVDCCVIDKGVIISKCIWGREGSANILLPENSGPHKEAMNFTKLAKQSVSKADLEIGQFVRMKDDVIAVYCGAYHGFGLDFDYETIYGGWDANYNRKMSYEYGFTPRMLPKRHVFLEQAKARDYQANGKIPGEGSFFSYSDTKNIAEFMDEKMVIDPKWVKTTALSPSGYQIFPKTASAVADKAFKKVEFKVVDGATPNTICMYEDPSGQLHFIGWNNFHQEYTRHSPVPREDRKLFINTCPVNASDLKLKETFKLQTAQIDNVPRDYFKDWKPKTLIAVLDDEIEVPVRIYLDRYHHHKGKLMSETSAYQRT